MIEENNRPDRVIAYIRKSSEDNEKGEASKQLNSINYQKSFVKDQQEKYGLEIVKTYQDDKTAYEAFVRKGFEEMLAYLKDHKQEIDGIVCTEISRLARNFADGGMLLWYMQSGIIKRIYTSSKIFTNSSTDQLMVAIEFAMSKKSSDDTGFRTKQGMRAKAQKLKHPSRPAVLGYKTVGPAGAKKWVIDPETGPLVEKVFRQFATGNYTFQEISEYAYQIGLRSNRSKTGKLSKNTWVNRLQDVQYTSIFFHEGEKIAGEYESLISPELFYAVQEIISGNSHPKKTHVQYAYSGLITCGLCGGNLSGTHKKGHTYYRCSKRKKPCKDLSLPYVREDEIEKHLLKELKKIEIDQELWKAAKDYVVELNQPHKIDLKADIRRLNEQISREEAMQINIGRRFSNGELTKTEYKTLKEDSKQKEFSLRKAVVKCENLVDDLDELMADFLDSIKYVTKKLAIVRPENKREFIDVFCENLVWEDEKLRWEWKKPYYFLAKQPKKSMMLSRVDSNHEP